MLIYTNINDILYLYLKFLWSIGVTTFFWDLFMDVVAFSLTFTQCANPWVIVAFSLRVYVNFLFNYFVYKIFVVVVDMF